MDSDVETTTAVKTAPVKAQKKFSKPKRSSKSKRSRDDKRRDEMRERKGAQFMEAKTLELKKNLYVGYEEADDVMAALKEIRTTVALNLSITTRQIGFAVSHLAMNSLQVAEIRTPPNIYMLYRCFLLLTESKIYQVASKYPALQQDVELFRRPSLNPVQLRAASLITHAPTAISNVVNSIGIVKDQEVTYLPAVAAPTHTRQGAFVPTPENIVFTSLRETVEALADEDTPREYRRRFRAHSPLPGATWSNDDLLLNPEMFWPDGYDDHNLFEETRLIQPYLISVQRHLPKHLVGCSIERVDMTGSHSLFWSSSMQDLRQAELPEGVDLMAHLQNTVTHGDVSEFWSRAVVDSASTLVGVMNLTGEQPMTYNQMQPYHLRDEKCCSYRVRIHYNGVMQMCYGF